MKAKSKNEEIGTELLFIAEYIGDLREDAEQVIDDILDDRLKGKERLFETLTRLESLAVQVTQDCNMIESELDKLMDSINEDSQCKTHG